MLSVITIACPAQTNEQTTKKSNKTSILGTLLGSSDLTQTLSNTLGSVLGTDKPKESDLIGTWNYKEPGIAFTTENALAKVGGEVAAEKIKSDLSDNYSKLGFSGSNTQFVFNEDKSFSGQIDGKPLTGTWSYDESNQKINLKMLLFSLPVYVKKTSNGMSFLMESKKLITLFQTAASLTNNSTLKAVSSLSKNYDGIRMGFDMSK